VRLPSTVIGPERASLCASEAFAIATLCFPNRRGGNSRDGKAQPIQNRPAFYMVDLLPPSLDRLAHRGLRCPSCHSRIARYSATIAKFKTACLPISSMRVMSTRQRRKATIK
jgi:hypothetical protein